MSVVRVPASKSHFGAILGSLAAGIAAMIAVGAMASFVVDGGLEARPASASTPLERMFAGGPAVLPLDVARVRAELAASETSMRATQRATDGAIARLRRLSID